MKAHGSRFSVIFCIAFLQDDISLSAVKCVNCCDRAAELNRKSSSDYVKMRCGNAIFQNYNA